jgi:hypothetical protein
MIQFLQDNSKNQFVITTHSAAILDAVECDILHVTHDGEQSFVKHIELDKQKFDAVTDLGYHASDLVQSNFVIWVEGPSDRIYLNSWIKLEDNSLIEGKHYSIMFYAGRLLNHICADNEHDESIDDFINIFNINQNAAILIDSDKKNSDDKINDTKTRIQTEFSENGHFCWVTEGREIENYIHEDALNALKAEFPQLMPSRGQFDKTYNRRFPKKDFAAKMAEQSEILDVLDLRSKIKELVEYIKNANN